MKTIRLLGLITVLWSISAVAQSNPVPFISQPLIPVTVKPGHAAFTLTVNGSEFASTAAINWNGTPRATQFFSSSQLKATIDAADVAHAGTVSVTVTNPAPGGGTSNAVLFPIQGPASSVTMFPSTSFPEASTNAVGDFNGDGIPDIVVGINTFPGEIDLYPGKGDGTFGKPIRTKTLVAVQSLLAADFNQDGKLDLAASDANGTVTIYLGDGKGGFSQQQVFRENVAVALQTADFNGDGKLDLAISIAAFAGQAELIDIRLGKGDGTFGAPHPFSLPRNSFEGNPAIGDFNQDGKLDMALPSYGTIYVALGNGDGTFTLGTSYSTGQTTQFSAVAADINGDCKLDIVTSGLFVLLGNGDGTFTLGNGVQLQNSSTANVNLADFNGDGKLDAAVAVYDNGTNGIELLLGNGDGTFQAPLIVLAPSGSAIVNLSTGDFQGVGKLDLVGGALLLQSSARLSPGSLAFGDQNVGSKSSPHNVTLTNVSSSALDITNISVTGDPKDFEQTNKCSSSLPPHASCQIKVSFAPQSVGAKQASLSVSYQGLGSPQTVSLTGTGVSAGTVTLKPSSLTFAVQLLKTTSSPQDATLTNTGSMDVTISNISTSGPFSQINNCPSDLPAGANCKIEVAFIPTAKGPASGTLSVTDNAKGSPQTVALSGTGTEVKLEPKGVNFGDQMVGTKSSPIGIELTNVGTTSLSISGIAIKGTDPGDFSQTNNCGNSVPAGGHCTIKVQFVPQAKEPRSATLTVSDDGGGSPQTVALAGTGT
jgi:hypothetical protein